jgi:lipoate synthase
MKHVTTIKVPFSLEEMKKEMDPKKLDKICDEELGPNILAQCFSAKYVDSDDKPILFYFGNRITKASHIPAVGFSSLKF